MNGTTGNRIDRTTVANGEEDARLAPIPRAHYELPGWVTVVGGIVCALALAFIGDPMALGFALPPVVLSIAKVLVFIGGAMGLTGAGVRFSAPVPFARPVQPPPSLLVDPNARPALRATARLIPRDDAPIPFEPEDRAP